MPSRLQRQFHVTGTQYISTDKVQSKTLNTGGTAEDYFSPWAISPGRFLLYLDIRFKIPFDPNIIYICHIKPAAPHSAESAQRHSAPPCIRQYTAQKFICFVCICRSLRCGKKAHCLSAASLRFFWTLLADFQTLRYTRLRNRTPNK